MTIHEEYAERLPDFIEKINIIKNEANKKTGVLWFRGVPSDSYDLMPSICRNGLTPKFENELLNRFKAKALPFLQSKPDSTWGWLFLMQHFGIPTRLLDWTEEALIALTFAINYRNSKHNDSNAVVWCLEPIGLNSNFNFNERTPVGKIPNIEENEINDRFNIDEINKPISVASTPIAIIGPMNNERIIAQRGVFTLFPPKEDLVQLNNLQDANNYLYKIIIPEKSIEHILEELNSIGIKLTNLFPCLDSIAEDIIGDIETQRR